METYKNLKKGTKIGLLVMAILVLIGTVNAIITAFSVPNRTEAFVIVHWLSDLLMFVLIVVYALFVYKKPHGNMLRMTFFLFAAYVFAHCLMPTDGLTGITDVLSDAMNGFASLIIAYIAGRLNKIEKNRPLMIVVGVLMLASNMMVIVTFPSNILRVIGVLSEVIIWAALCLAYMARYREHKAAGLEDQ